MSEVLCQRCGLCCDGSLFTRVPLTPEESVPEVELGVVRTEHGGRYVPQRCAALEGTSCRQYARRPLACRRYECLLFVAVRDGETTAEEAEGVVVRAKALLRAAVDDAGRRERDEFLAFHFGRRA